MKEYKFNINGNEYIVGIAGVEDDKATVMVNGATYDLEVTGAASKPASKAHKAAVRKPETAPADHNPPVTKAPAAAGDGAALRSPLPGVIIDLKVREGDSVKMGQTLLILEAMKMENNIDSDRDGIVKQIKVQRGDSVLEGDVLITIG